eukprot:g988.t1
MSERPDVLIIGGGIAGASLGAELAAEGAAVTVLEAEDQPGYHATGRSAAHFIECYGPPPVRAFNKATRPFLERPPADFAERGFLKIRPLVWIATEADAATLDALVAAESCLAPLPVAEAVRRAPILKADGLDRAAVEETAADIDVGALHQAYLAALKRSGGRVIAAARAARIERRDGLWTVETVDARYAAPVLVNAAGAWAGEIGAMAGLPPVRLNPMRRSAALLPAPEAANFTDWPLVGDIGERFYFKPEAGKLLVSPADEIPSPPTDAHIDDMVLAEGLDRFERATTYQLTRVEKSWAGLRTFANDRVPLVGFDSADGGEGFFWFAGQGGYGVQTSAAMAWTGAALIQRKPIPARLAALGLETAALDPRRATPAALIH